MSKKEFRKAFFRVSVFGLALVVGVLPFAKAYCFDLKSAFSKSMNCCKEKQVISYFTEEKISDAQQKAYDITNKYYGKTDRRSPHFSMLSNISSKRGYNNPTELEKILDKAVMDDDLPIEAFTLDEIKNVKNSYAPNPGVHPKYEIVSGGYDAINLHKTAADGAIVQVASQYNCLESVSTDFSPVRDWYYDKTQGPMACLQAVAATKHRESAALQGKLPDAIKGLLEGCTVPSSKWCSFKKSIRITDKYPFLYQNGYFQATEVGKKSLSDLRELANYIKNNKGQLGFNSQWVKCEGTGKKQLHVFNAAPSFQYDWDLDWDNENDEYIQLYEEICKSLVAEQYRAIAQVAAIKSAASGKQVELHLCQVGQGAFYNTLKTMPEALKAVKEELEGFNVKVYLHEGYGGRARPWSVIMNSIF